MPDIFIFTDEAGCMTFTRKAYVSRYFILCTVMMNNCKVACDLLELRRSLAWNGEELSDSFHAQENKQAVRDKVYQAILKHDFTIQATMMEKSKAGPNLKLSRHEFYKYGYFYHFKFGILPLLANNSETLITTASIGSKKERKSFEDSVNSVMSQTIPQGKWKTDFMPAQVDPCLQVTDYCAWAIQRKWERNDSRSYDLIKDRITYEYDLWHKGTIHYY